MSLLNFLKSDADDGCLRAVVSGEVKPIEAVEDEVFSTRVLGDGVAFEPEGSQCVVAPAGGVVTIADETMPHAVGLKLNTGEEVLIHIGIDTVEMEGRGFRLRVRKGEKVKTGQPLVEFDLDAIRASGHAGTVILVVTETARHTLGFLSGMKGVAGQTVVGEYR